MKLVLDAGALIGIDRHDRRVAGLIQLGRRAAADLVTTAPVIGQVWRDGSRQAQLARALAMVDVRHVGFDDAKSAGILLAHSGTSDVVDALVALLAQPGDQVLTSDPGDMDRLASAHRSDVRIVAV
jgi:hypothetical protein